MKVCDSCAATLVNKDMIHPAGHFFDPNEIPWERGICPLCKKEANLSEHVEIKSIQEDNVVIVKETIHLSPEEFDKKFKTITEGKVSKGGRNDPPKTPRPDPPKGQS